MKLCRNCCRRQANRPRGLCWSCYYTPSVRDRYESTSKFGRRGLHNGHHNAPLPVPTTVPPGTPEKLEILAARARARQALWHPCDATFEGDPRPLLWLENNVLPTSDSVENLAQ